MTAGEAAIGGRLDQSAREVLAEIGNIVLGACLSGFGDMMQTPVSFSVPRIHIESLKTILRSLLIDDSEVQYAVIVATQFRLSALEVDGYLVVAVGAESLVSHLPGVVEPDRVACPSAGSWPVMRGRGRSRTSPIRSTWGCSRSTARSSSPHGTTGSSARAERPLATSSAAGSRTSSRALAPARRPRSSRRRAARPSCFHTPYISICSRLPPPTGYAGFSHMQQSVRLIPLRAADGTPQGAVALITDVTERVAREEELRAAMMAAQEANRAKSEFLAAMSHELRTPIGAMLGYADLVAEGIFGPIDATQRGPLLRIKAVGSHLLSIVEQILTFARIEAAT